MKNKLTIGQFQRITDIDNDISNPLHHRLMTLSVLTDKEEDVLRSMGFIELQNEIDKVNKEWDYEVKEIPRKTKLEINGKVYFPITDLQKITAGQLIDMSSMAAEEKDIIPNLHKIAAIICRANKREYSTKDFEERSLFLQQHCLAEDIYSIAVFFCKIVMKLPSLLPQMEKMKNQINLQKSGDGLSS